MNRITPEQILDAYAKTNMKPIVGSMYEFTDKAGPCGCALGTLYFATTGKPNKINKDELGNITFEEASGEISKQVIDWYDDKYTDKYIVSFANGFDGSASVGQDTIGYMDGVAARKAVMEKYGRIMSWHEIYRWEFNDT